MHNILVIEGRDELRENTCNHLRRSGYNAIAAANGITGIEAAKSEKPDIIFCNTSLPDMDGLCVPGILSKNKITSAIPVIMLSPENGNGSHTGHLKEDGQGAGAAPGALSLLDSIIRSAVKKPGSGSETPAASDFLARLLVQSYPFKLPGNIPPEFKIRNYSKKENIYYEGDLPAALYLVLKGRVKTIKLGSEGKEFITGIHEKGEIFGHTAIFIGADNSDSAIAMLDSEILLIPGENVSELISSNHHVAGSFIRLLAAEIALKEERLKNLAYNSVRARVAGVLMELGCYKDEKEKKQVFNAITISREDLASIVGTASESLVRTLSDFRHENIIDTDRGKIIITDPDCLNRIRKFS